MVLYNVSGTYMMLHNVFWYLYGAVQCFRYLYVTVTVTCWNFCIESMRLRFTILRVRRLYCITMLLFIVLLSDFLGESVILVKY